MKTLVLTAQPLDTQYSKYSFHYEKAKLLKNGALPVMNEAVVINKQLLELANIALKELYNDTNLEIEPRHGHINILLAGN